MLRAIAFLVCHFGQTVAIAQLNKTLHMELSRRAEYAMKFGVHTPTQWLTRLLRR